MSFTESEASLCSNESLYDPFDEFQMEQEIEYSTLEHFTGPIAIDYSAKMAMPKLCDPLLTSHLN